jgi:methionine-rich copper-binding protein CopC
MEMKMNKRMALMLAVVSMTVSGAVLAHAHLKRSEPADQSVVAEAPKNLTIAFNEAVTVTALTIQKGDGKPQPLGPLAKEAAKQQSYALPALAPGSYIVKWRAMSDDKHLMSGKLTFKVGTP